MRGAGLGEALAAVGDRLAGQDAQQGRFAGAVAADQRQPLAGRDGEVDAVQDRLVAEVKADAGERQEGWFGHDLGKVGPAVMAEAVHNGKGHAAEVWSGMLRVVGEPKRIDRAIKRLQGALKGVPARGVRLTWRGGELRTTIHWARDDASGGRSSRAAPAATARGARMRCCWATRPMRRPSARASPARSTCRAPAPTGRWRASSPPTRQARSTSPIPAAWAARGSASARRASASSWPTACGGD